MSIETLRRDALALLRPPPKQSTADFIESTVFLPASASAQPGRIKLWAPQRGICDAIDDPTIERVSVLKSARVGYSALLQGVTASYVANAPAPIIMLRPTIDDARRAAVDLEQVFDASPALRGGLALDESGRSTMYDRRFPGGSLKAIAARAPRNLRDHTAKILMADEIDAYEISDEGDPLSLAEMRTTTFRDRKIIVGSTPVFAHGAISRAYAKSDKRVFEVPCPSCGEFAVLKWADMRWEEGDPATTYWACPANGCVVHEQSQTGMVEAGRWRATAPEVKGHAGFAINALSSPHYSQRWSALVAEFLEAKKSPDTLQTFVNTVLGEPWTQAEGDGLDEDALMARREPFSLAAIPDDVLIMTAGVDVQNDRLELVLLGHGHSDVFVLDHQVFYGPVDGDAAWAELDAYLRRTWPHPNGGTLSIDFTLIDSGSGGHTEIVHSFTKPRARRRIYSCKGDAGFRRPLCERSRTQTHLFIVGVDAVKSRLFDRLARPDGGVRFSETLAPVYFEQLASERLTTKYRAGRPQQAFERIKGKAAETLDATVYAWAARQIVNVNLDHRAETLASRVQAARPAPQVVHSTWLQQGPRW